MVQLLAERPDGVLDVTGSPRLVTLRLESLMRDPSGISHAYGQRRAFADEHMPVPTGPGPRRSTQSIYNTRLSEVLTSHQYGYAATEYTVQSPTDALTALSLSVSLVSLSRSRARHN